MMNAPRKLYAGLALVVLLQAQSVAAAPGWDLIHVDRLDVTLCSNGCGITLAGQGFGLLVNTGDSDLEHADIFGATFEVESSVPEVSLRMFVNDPVNPVIAPILPGQAVGSVLQENQLLLGLMEPGETHRNTAPQQFLAFIIQREYGSTYVGPVTYDIRMRMAHRLARFAIAADVELGPHAISFSSAARAFRVASVLESSTPVRPTTWGTIKQLYR